MAQHVQLLKGQAPAGSYYPGQRSVPSMMLQGRPGQRELVGSASPEPAPNGKCTESREVDGVYQRCGAWAVKDSDPQLCIGHQRSKAVKNGDDSTADQGLRQDAP